MAGFLTIAPLWVQYVVMRHVVWSTIAITAVILLPTRGRAQSRPARETFEAASIKLNQGCSGNADTLPAPGRVNLICQTPRGLIRIAYVMFGDGVSRNVRQTPILGGPAWLDMDTYDVLAKSEGGASVAFMHGPMLQALLETRFGLKVHKENRPRPVYKLTEAKGGARLQPTKPESCTPLDPNHLPQPGGDGQPAPIFCGRASIGGDGVNLIVDVKGITMAVLADRLQIWVDRPVTNETGLSGLFDVHLEFAKETGPPRGGPGDPQNTPDAVSQSIFTAIQSQLGLRLSPATGAEDVLVVDQIARPTEN